MQHAFERMLHTATCCWLKVRQVDIKAPVTDTIAPAHQVIAKIADLDSSHMSYLKHKFQSGHQPIAVHAMDDRH